MRNKIVKYIKELKKLGIIFDLEDVMDVSFETSEEISLVIDGEINIDKNKIKIDR